MLKKAFFIFIFVSFLAAGAKSVGAETRPNLLGLDKASASVGEQVTLLGKDFMAEWAGNCSRPSGERTACNCKLSIIIRLDNPNLYPHIPTYPLNIISLTPTEIVTVIPDIPVGNYDICMTGLCEVSNVSLGTMPKIKITNPNQAAITAKPSPTQALTSPTPKPTNASEPVTGVPESAPVSEESPTNFFQQFINLFSGIITKISQFFSRNRHSS